MKCPVCGGLWFDADEEYSIESCRQCDLGPANDTPEVMVEIRAAEVEAQSDDVGWFQALSSDEREAWWEHAFGRSAPTKGAAGWLARQIAMHGDTP